MTFNERINEDASTVLREDLARALIRDIGATAQLDKVAAIAACDAALDVLAPSWPEVAPFFGTSREEADFWVEFASDTMRSEMLAACMRHAAKHGFNTTRAAKVAMMAIWNNLSEQDRTAFLERVDPGPVAKA